jgi:penicillin-binding protein-related factor A (putative recombinase)
MLSPLELLKEAQRKLFSLSPSQALELKAKTKQLLKDLPLPQYQQVAHQISQYKKVRENFLPWLDTECRCEECEN